MAYSQPTYAGGKGTADAPRLGATSDNISGYDQTTAAVVNAVKQQAAKEGLTAWGYSFLKQLGEAIKPEWLKESSREWFNKPLPDPLVPPKDDFLKIVEPAVLKNTTNNPQGIVTQAIRDKGGFGGLWEKYHKEEGDLDQRYAELPAYLDPKRISDKAALYDSEGRALPGTPQTPSLRAQAEADAQKLAADQAVARDRYSYTDEASRRTAEANFAADHKWNSTDAIAARNAPAVAPPGSPVTPFVPTGQAPGNGTTPAPTTTAAPDTTAKNFLPPYLQPVGETQGKTSAMLDVSAPAGSWDTMINGVPNIPGQTAPVTPAGSPMAPFVPQGVGQVPGQPLVTGAPRKGIGGGFAATAKLLELPYYLRQSYG